MHLELVKRSQEIIKLYARNHKMTQNHINKMWECTMIDETMLIEIYNVVQTTATALDDEVIEMFIIKIKDQMDPSKQTMREVDFVHSLGKSSH
jgi:hypothetical protein